MVKFRVIYKKYLQYSDVYYTLKTYKYTDAVRKIVNRCNVMIWNAAGYCILKRLDQGHLHPKLEVPGLKCAKIYGPQIENPQIAIFAEGTGNLSKKICPQICGLCETYLRTFDK